MKALIVMKNRKYGLKFGIGMVLSEIAFLGITTRFGRHLPAAFSKLCSTRESKLLDVFLQCS